MWPSYIEKGLFSWKMRVSKEDSLVAHDLTGCSRCHAADFPLAHAE